MDLLCREAYQRLDLEKRAKLGQFSTPSSIARQMASMFSKRTECVKILDAGAGVGSLSAALISEICQWDRKPKSINITAYEIEPKLIDYLYSTFGICDAICKHENIEFVSNIFGEDFIEDSISLINGGFLPDKKNTRFNYVILNPPYRKIHSKSQERRLLKRIGIETCNLYTAFLWLAIELLEPGGELVAITPRSFCNGLYFQHFREAFFKSMILRQVHIFESRTKAFQKDAVLQENIIIHAIKSTERNPKVIISSSVGPDDGIIVYREVDHDQLVQPNDPSTVIHIVTGEKACQIGQCMNGLDSSLDNLGLEVSTGRVVDFRAKKKNILRRIPTDKTVPLIYPAHFVEGFIKWPIQSLKKPEAIMKIPKAYDLLVPAGFYVLVKRFTSKEESKRIVAAVFDPNRITADMIGFENHLNYYHMHNHGMPSELAKGLAAFLNSTLVDQYFRQFSGHTQVNATDLRNLRYPNEKKLMSLGSKMDGTLMQQDDLDYLANKELGISLD
ncbi:MAG: Eco57I restriction-modification methylase domain-containing protein [Methanotrichaceae archaeon]